MQNIILCISLSFVTSAVTATHITPDVYNESKSNLIESSSTFSLGDTVGITDYDWQSSGSMGRRVLITPLAGYHFAWIGDYPWRRACYNYHYPPSYWLGPIIPVNSALGGMAQFADGRAVLLVLGNTLLIDAIEGAGMFTAYDLPDDSISWTKIRVDNFDNIYISGYSDEGLFVIFSTDEGTTWSNPMLVDSNGYNSSWAGFNEKVVLVYNNFLLNILYYESTDHGTTWTADTIFIPSPEDSVQGYIWNSAIYDNNSYLHVALTCIDTIPNGGGASGSGWRSQIRHWNQETDQISIVDNGTGWVNSNPGPGANHPTNSEPQIAIDRLTGDLYCTWCHADPQDVAANGLVNMDIWGAKSTDNGATWIEQHNITNSPTPGATAGNCDNDHVNHLAEETLDDTLVMFYLNDKDAGNAAFPPDPGAILTDSPLLFYLYKWNPYGVEEISTTTPPKLSMNVTPNPSTRNAQIAYTLSSAGNVSLKLCSIDGRLVKTIYDGHKNSGVHKENFDFSGIANGIYFVILETATAKASRSVVVIH
jgi:hypothetical protein